MTMIRRFFALPFLVVLAACASSKSDGGYPSLAIRPAERASGTMQPPPAEPVLTAPTPATLDRVSQLTADADGAHSAFEKEVARSRNAVTAGRGATVGDDKWAVAEAALADIRAARAKTMIPLADLDRLYVDAATQGEATDRIGAARDHVSRLVGAEDAVTSELSANLP